MPYGIDLYRRLRYGTPAGGALALIDEQRSAAEPPPPAPTEDYPAAPAPGTSAGAAGGSSGARSIIDEIMREKPEDEKKRHRLEAFRDISEGLSGIGAASLAGNPYRTDVAPPIATGIREQLKSMDEDEKMRRALALRFGTMTSDQMFKANEAEKARKARENIETVKESGRNTRAEGAIGSRESEGGLNRAVREKQIEATSGRQENLQANRAFNQNETALRVFNQDPTVTEARKVKRAAVAALAALDTGTGMGDIAAIVSSARASGDNRLSDTDIRLRLRPLGVTNTIETLASQWSKGRLSEEHRRQLRAVLQAYQDAADETIADRANQHAQQQASLNPKQFTEDQLKQAYTGKAGMKAAPAAAGKKAYKIRTTSGEEKIEPLTPEELKALQSLYPDWTIEGQ